MIEVRWNARSRGAEYYSAISYQQDTQSVICKDIFNPDKFHTCALVNPPA